jgi:hypothetical protein
MARSITILCIKCHHAECHDLFIVTLNVLVFSVVMLNVVAPGYIYLIRVEVTDADRHSSLSRSVIFNSRDKFYDTGSNSVQLLPQDVISHYVDGGTTLDRIDIEIIVLVTIVCCLFKFVCCC